MTWPKDGPPITPEQLAALPPEFQALLRAVIEHYERQIIQLRAEISQLQAENARLKAELAGIKKTPQNSSLPPSTQHPHAKPAPPRPKSQKQRGGQPGHPRHERTLIPTEDCQKVVPLKPVACQRCGTPLCGSDPVPLRHQVCELPVIEPCVTEYQRHRLTCSRCGESTCGELPAGVPQSQAGPRLVALVTLLMGSFRQSKRRVALFLEQILGQPCSPGWVVKLQNQATAALRPAYEELADQLPTEPVLGIDETAHKQGRLKTWLWTCVAATYTVFALRASRAATVLIELLGSEFQGCVNCDRAKMYWCLGRLQWCWAHLKRDFQALIDSSDGQAKRLGQDLMRPTRKLFVLWVRYRDGTLSRRAFRCRMRPLRREVEGLLLRGRFSGNAAIQGMCQELHTHREWLWTFVDSEGVEPTNNASERALRHGVIWRKLSFGTQSAAGSRFVETILTVVETCRQQKRNVFAFVSETLEAHFARQPGPSLLPRV